MDRNGLSTALKRRSGLARSSGYRHLACRRLVTHYYSVSGSGWILSSGCIRWLFGFYLTQSRDERGRMWSPTGTASAKTQRRRSLALNWWSGWDYRSGSPGSILPPNWASLYCLSQRTHHCHMSHCGLSRNGLPSGTWLWACHRCWFL